MFFSPPSIDRSGQGSHRCHLCHRGYGSSAGRRSAIGCSLPTRSQGEKPAEIAESPGLHSETAGDRSRSLSQLRRQYHGLHGPSTEAAHPHQQRAGGRLHRQGGTEPCLHWQVSGRDGGRQEILSEARALLVPRDRDLYHRFTPPR